jgi:hypothetical protein
LAEKKRIFTFLIVILIFLTLSVETGLRWLKLPYTSYGNWLPIIYQPHQTIGYIFVQGIEATYHRYFEWETEIKANAEGWRDYDYPHEKSRDTFRIACIGDSYTVNLEVPMDKNYPKTLEQILQKRHSPKIEVMNFSIDGTGTDSHYLMFREFALKYKPDMVIHSFHDSDIKDIQRGIIYRQGYKKMIIQYQTLDELKRGKTMIDDWFYRGLAPLKHFLLGNSYFFRFFFRVLGITWPDHYILYAYRENKKTPYTYKGAVEKTKKLLKKFKALADENQINYLMVFLHYEDIIRHGGNPLNILRDFLEEQKMTYLDTYEPFKQAVDKRELYWKYDAHITEEGCRLIAENVADFLQQNNLLQQKLTGVTSAQ